LTILTGISLKNFTSLETSIGITKFNLDLRVVYDLEKIKELDRLKKRSSDAILNSIDLRLDD